ncbi:hypothetical protein BDV26DRAFT_267042 [Aspergillus bertholletiae]|uniref:Uncharacterized protein n=1 Tax=Aspergillus bertholletiae TaxID=1226010 RepID=A0A5N7B1A7_9EURO|nr:hypothetical protein BDV26DRAFT_267042 [Aspergillus bertholletiae]
MILTRLLSTLVLNAHKFEKLAISKNRFYTKVPLTRPALNASLILLKEATRTLATTLYSLPQAFAANKAQCLSNSPYINCEYHTGPPHSMPVLLKILLCNTLCYPESCTTKRPMPACTKILGWYNRC